MLFFVIRRGKTTIKTETVKRKSLFWLRVKSKLKGQVEGSQHQEVDFEVGEERNGSRCQVPVSALNQRTT